MNDFGSSPGFDDYSNPPALQGEPVFDEDSDPGYSPGYGAEYDDPVQEIASMDISSQSLPISGSVIVEDQAPKKKRRPWLFMVFLLLIGVGTAAAIGLTGPNLGSGDSDGKTPSGGESEPNPGS